MSLERHTLGLCARKMPHGVLKRMAQSLDKVAKLPIEFMVYLEVKVEQDGACA